MYNYSIIHSPIAIWAVALFYYIITVYYFSSLYYIYKTIKIICCWFFLFDIFRYSAATRRFVSFEKSLFQALQSLPFVALSFILYYCFRSWHFCTHTLKLLQLQIQCIIFTLFLLILWLIYWSLHTNMLQFSLPLCGIRPNFFYLGSGALLDMAVSAWF